MGFEKRTLRGARREGRIREAEERKLGGATESLASLKGIPLRCAKESLASLESSLASGSESDPTATTAQTSQQRRHAPCLLLPRHPLLLRRRRRPLGDHRGVLRGVVGRLGLLGVPGLVVGGVLLARGEGLGGGVGWLGGWGVAGGRVWDMEGRGRGWVAEEEQGTRANGSAEHPIPSIATPISNPHEGAA